MTYDLESGNDAAAAAATDEGNGGGISGHDVEEAANDTSPRPVHPVSVLIKNLNVDIDVSPNGPEAVFSQKKNSKGKEVKPILKDVNAFMPSGNLTAITGSGNTNVLNSLSRRFGGERLETTGDITYNSDAKLSSI